MSLQQIKQFFMERSLGEKVVALMFFVGVLIRICWPTFVAPRLVNWHTARANRKREITDKIDEFCDVLPRPLTPEQSRNVATYRQIFYTGMPSADPRICVSLNFDAERSLLQKVRETIKTKRSNEWFHIPIYGDRKQGKTVLIARLAHNLSQQKRLRFFGRKYHILWCRQLNNSFRQYLQEGADLTTYAHKLSEYRKHFARRKRVVIFIDDFFQSGHLQSDDTLELQLQSLKAFLSALNEARISIITCSSTNDPVIFESEPSLLKLTLEEEDVKSILSKLEEEGFITKEFADSFSRDPANQRLYQKQLFAFFNLLCSKPGCEAAFIQNFEKQFNKISEHEAEKSAWKTIALCQLLDIYLPEAILQKAFPEAFESLQKGLGGLVIRERDSQYGDADYVYHMGGPFLAKRFLDEKFLVRTGLDLKPAFQSILDMILRRDVFDSSPKTVQVLNLMFKRLAAEWHRLLFVDAPAGKTLAISLFCHSKDRLQPYLNDLTQPGDLVAWAATMRDLRQEGIARTLYQKAAEVVQIPEGPPTVDNMRTPVTLAMGLSAMPDSTSKNEAVSLLEKITEKYLTAEEQTWLLVKVIHKLAETLHKTGQQKKALDVLNKLPPTIPSDALMLQLKGDILVAQGDIKKANDCFKQSIASKNVSRNPQTFFNCLLHYADFLVHPNVAKQLCEDPDPYLNQAETFFNDTKNLNGYEVLLNVRAKRERNRGDIKEAKKIYERCLSYCREKGIVHPHSWLDFARLLRDCGDQASFAEAESLCREVIDYPDVDTKSKCAAAHILGGLVGHETYTFDGKERPNFSEAVLILQDAFESPEPDRNDDQNKTYQDAITHNLLKDTYLRWYDSNQPVPEGRDKLLAKADFHFQKAFSGLPRPNLRQPEVIEHALLAQAHYAGFLWKPRAGDPNLDAAEQHYKDAIAKFEANSHTWPDAYELYEFYTNFLYYTKRADPHVIVAFLRKALELVSPDNRDARAKISWKLARNLRTDFIDNLDSLAQDTHGPRIDEIISLFTQSLALKLEEKDTKAAAGELSHVFFVPSRGILEYLCTKDRVTTVINTLWQTWDACPTNDAALVGILDIADSIIDKCFHDESALCNLERQINAKAVDGKMAAYALGRACEARRDKPYRGKLTNMLWPY